MKLTYENKIFTFHCTYNERQTPKDAHFWWNGKNWVTESVRWASTLLKYADPGARKILLLSKQKPSKKKHRKTDVWIPERTMDDRRRGDNKRVKTSYRYNM